MKRKPLQPEPPLRKEYPTGLAPSCMDFVGRELRVWLHAGWGWSHYIDGIQQPSEGEEKYHSGHLIAKVRGFFECDGRLRGFTGVVQAPDHVLDGLNAVFFTLGDGVDFDFRENICMTWGARFGSQEPLTAPGIIPDFDEGRVYIGYAAVFEDEESLKRTMDRLQEIDPRRQRGANSER